jgi:hypothetical protein
MITGRRTLCWVKSLRRSSHCLIESRFWSSKAWLALESLLVIYVGEFNLWKRGRTTVLSTLELRTLLVWSQL